MGNSQLYEKIINALRSNDIPLVGGFDLKWLFNESSWAEIWNAQGKYYSEWLEAGHHGEMAYLKRGEARRRDPRLVMPNAASIVSIGVPYSAAPYGTQDPEIGVQYARYIRGSDYHKELKERLEESMLTVARDFPELQWKVCVDTSAVLERSIAWLSGLGWIGKNSMLIHPRWGSFLFLGEILLSGELDREPSPHPDYCGHCERCLKSCPTGAFLPERSLDSRRCISYWTLEKRGELDLSERDRSSIGNRVAGCDICQEVCPFNRKRMLADETSADLILFKWDSVLAESVEEYRERVRGTALDRVKPAEFRRNVLNAKSSSGVEDQPQ